MADAVPPPTDSARDVGRCQTPVSCGETGCHGSCDDGAWWRQSGTTTTLTMAGGRVVTAPLRIRWWHRTVSGLVLAACTVVAAGVCWLVSWLALCVFLGGCAVGYPLRDDGTPDTGDAIIGISTGTANAAGAGLLSLGGLLSGNPALVGLAALVANQMGKRAGWDERESAAMVQAPLPDAKGGKA